MSENIISQLVSVSAIYVMINLCLALIAFIVSVNTDAIQRFARQRLRRCITDKSKEKYIYLKWFYKEVITDLGKGAGFLNIL